MVYKSSIALSSGAGSVTQINTGTGLTGGPITSSGTISIAPGTANTLAGFDNTGAFSGVTVGSGLSLVAGTLTATGGGSGTVTTTGSPASGNLTKFSGATSITNADLSGDITTSGTLATTLATVNANVGSFGSSTAIPNFTVNGKGLITAAGTNVVIAPAGTLTGATLAANVLASSLTSVGTLATLTVTATITGSISGNAGTATALQTARAIGGVNFDGTAAITPTQIQPASEGSDTTCFPLFVNAASGTAQQPKYNASFGFNASTTTISANLSGAVNGVTLTTGGSSSNFLDATGNYSAPSGSGTVTTTGTPASGNLTKFSGASSITNGDLSGDITTSGTLATTLATVNANVGSFGSATQVGAFTVNAKGLITAASNVTITPAVGSITGLGTGVATALAINIGTAGSPLVNGGVLGTPSSGTATNLTGTASGLTAGNVTTNANLTGPITSSGNATSIASQTGTGTKFVVDTSPTLVTPNIGVATGTSLAASGVLTSGANSGTNGSLKLFGSTSGDVTIKAAAAAGTATNFQLPATNGSNTNVLQTDGSGNTSWAAAGAGTVTTVSVVTANGFAGTVATATSTPAITLTTSVTGILSGNGTAISAASTTGSGAVVLAGSPTLTGTLTVPNMALTDNTNQLVLGTTNTGTISMSALSGNRTWTFPNGSGNVVLTSVSATLSNKTMDNTNTYAAKDTLFTLQDDGDATKTMNFQLSGITTATNRVLTVPDASGTMTLLGNASTGSGSVVLATSPTLVTPVLGVASATTINKVTVTAPATGSTLTIADGVTVTAPTTTNVLVISGTAKLSVGTSTPGSPATGDLWVDTN